MNVIAIVEHRCRVTAQEWVALVTSFVQSIADADGNKLC